MSKQHHKSPLLIGLRAARANLVPGLIVQALMVALVLGYYFVPSSRFLLQSLADAKDKIGLPFPMLATFLAGAVAPEIVKILYFQRGRPRKNNVYVMSFTGINWACQGAIVYYMYRMQSHIFGDAIDFRTIAPKVLVDQFLFNPFFAAIVNTIVYDLVHRGFSGRNLRSCLTWQYYKSNVLPVLVATWGVWVPIVTAVYSLPQPLQFPLFMLSLTFWAILLAWIGGRQAEATKMSEAERRAETAASI